MKNSSKTKLLALCLSILGYFDIAQSATDEYQRDVADYNSNGIRDDIDREIIKYTSDLTERQMLQHYAFFASQSLKNTGTDLVHDYAEMLKIRYCFGFNKTEALIDIKARLMDSEESFAQFMRAEKEMANAHWSDYATRIDKCSFEPLAVGTSLEEYAINLYEEDICLRIAAHNGNGDPMVSKYLQQCEDAK